VGEPAWSVDPELLVDVPVAAAIGLVEVGELTVRPSSVAVDVVVDVVSAAVPDGPTTASDPIDGVVVWLVTVSVAGAVPCVV
jgi:hypothetical protein